MAGNIDVVALHDAIVDQFKEKYPDFHVQFYRGDNRGEREKVPVPCILLDCEEFEVDPESDPGNGQIATTWHFEAVIIIKELNVARARFAIRAIAASVAAFLHLRRWKDPSREDGGTFRTGVARVTGSSRDHFSSEFDAFAAWRVEWDQEINLGEDIWIDTGLMPGAVWLGKAPDIGFGHEQDYRQVIPEEGGDHEA